jgi:diguanylate cyclase (GGDEF)-like protein
VDRSAVSERNYHLWVTLVYLLTSMLAVAVMTFQFREIDRHTNALAKQRGEALFNLVELTRLWNAKHGGVYVPSGVNAQPNPYLEHSKRDLQASDGTLLTMINPAFMTRQIAELAQQSDGVQLHITSLRPLRPGNAPDAWETKALQAFEMKQASSMLALLDSPDGPVYRYMAPLQVKPPCLACHVKQGYQVGDVRGGISVTMDARPLLVVRDAQCRQVVMVFGGAALLIAFLLHLLLARQYRHVRHFQQINLAQEQLIAERTEHLHLANRELQDEIQQRKSLEEQLRQQAHFDTLTGLPNRALFEDRLNLVFAQAQRYQNMFALAYLDLDYFKDINDSMGHAVGDKVLVETARRLLLEVRESDTVARIGGDEFVIILHRVDEVSEVEMIATRINACMAEPFVFGDITVGLSVSIGIALYPSHAESIEGLIDKADSAMYAAKENGRNTYRMASPGGPNSSI